VLGQHIRAIDRRQPLPTPVASGGALASERGAAKRLGFTVRRPPGGIRENNRAEYARLADGQRERKKQKFKSLGSAPRFLSRHAAVCKTCNLQGRQIFRPDLGGLRVQVDEAWDTSILAN